MINKRRKTTVLKSITVLLILIMSFLIYPFNSVVRAQSRTIYERSSKQIISSGAILENIVKFTDKGWLNINILRVDLSNRYIEVDSLSNTSSLQKLTTVKNLLHNRNAIAGVNASFFNPTGEGNGYPDGPIVESGEIISAYGEYNRYGDTMASFSIDDMGEVLYSYWKTDISIIAPNGESISVNQYNKPSRLQYSDYTVLDRRWSEKSIGVQKTWPDIIEVVVEDGKISEIRQSEPAVNIPVDGYVIVTRLANAAFILDNFKIGDRVELDIRTDPDWEDMEMAVTGSSILVKDGRIPDKFSYDIASVSKANPRTVIGSSRDGKELFLVTVDGRQNSSIGMTQREMADFMLRIGAYNALNFDGGGSTTMVARTPGTSSLEVVNSPSDGSERIVSTAVGIFSVAPPSSLEGLIIEADDENVFSGTSRKLTVRGYDRYFNPIEIDPDEIEWDVSGVSGKVKDSVFYPKSAGKAKITASIGNKSGSIIINSLSSPVELVLSEKVLKMSKNQSRTLSVTGKDKNGYSAIIYPEDVSWSESGNIGRFDSHRFTATSEGTGYISASLGGTYAYCAVSVSSKAVTFTDNFESSNGSFLSYPSTVNGAYELSDEQKRSGNLSGKLTYDFSANTEVTRAAYLVFANNGVALEPSTTKIGLWVYNTHINTNWLRAEIYDTQGNKHLVNLAGGMDWTGWKYIETSIDNTSFTPSRLTRIYLVQFHPVEDSGTIYLDDMVITASGFPSVGTVKIPEDTKPIDEAYQSIVYQESSDSFRFAVFGESHEPENPLENLLSIKLADKINNYIEAAAFVGNSAHSISASLEKPFVATGTGYKYFDIMDSRFIQLDTSKKGLRTSNINQWHWLLDQLDAYRGRNLFIFLSDSPDSFTDDLEGKLFKETLTQYVEEKNKNVWVFYKGSKNESYMERGVKYITTSGFDTEGFGPDNINAAQYILVTVKGNRATFEFKPII
ncbi:MAG: phosphodiester glycosidase family protein [Acetivibrionales bacterium]|jgi:exopolysaccharide biosynthesis protein